MSHRTGFHAIVFLALSAASNALAQPAANVVVTPVEASRETIEVQAVGASRAERSIRLFPETSGTVESIRIEADRAVTAGSVLLRLDDRAEQVAVALAAVELADTRRLLARYERAEGSGAFAPSTVDEARRDVELAELELQQAQIALDERTLRAPFDGYTGLTDIEPGDRITEETEVATLDNRETLTVRFSLPERFYGQFARGDAVSLNTWHSNGPKRTARIERIGSQVDSDVGTFPVEARVHNTDDALRPGMRFRVTARLEGPRAWRLPETALLWGDNGAYAWRIQGGKAERVGLELIARERKHVLVDGPLEAGQDVVSEGTQRIRPGIEVNLIDANSLDNYPALEAEREPADRP